MGGTCYVFKSLAEDANKNLNNFEITRLNF